MSGHDTGADDQHDEDEAAVDAEPRDGELEDGQIDEETEELIQEIQRRRSVKGTLRIIVAAIGITFSVFQLFLAAQGFEFGFHIPFIGEVEFLTLQLLQANAVHVAFALALTFLLYPPTTGDGFVARRLGRLYPVAEARFGADSAVTTLVGRLRSAVRWAFLDPDMKRVTPADVVLTAISFLAAVYFITDFQEIQNMRALGLQAGRPIQEVFTFLDPLVVMGWLGLESLRPVFVALDAIIKAIPGTTSSYAFVLGVIGVLLVLEATRRTIGLPLMIIVGSFIIYARWGFMIGQNVPYVGILSIPELTWESIIQNLWYNTENGVFGIPVTVSVQFIYIFILFGAFLEKSGSGQWFIDLAYSATGTRKGGPAKASILASGFMGTISGSSIANTVTTGAFTIPLMKRSGYKPEFAGAVEAAASSGGQILPPVMGAAAFLIVQYTVTPFADVIMVAAIPAIVFFFGVWVMVHLEAVRKDIGGLDPSELVNTRKHLRRGWFYLVPIGLLLFYLIGERLSVARSAWFTIVAVGALITLVAAYNDDTRLPLAALILVIGAIEFGTHLLGGVGILAIVSGQAAGPMSIGDAWGAVVGNFGWYAVTAGVLVLLVRPRVETPLLELDRAVDETADELATGINRPDLHDNQLFRLATYGATSMESGARTAVPVVIAVAAAGIIPGVISVSGLGPNLVSLILQLAAGSLVLMLLMTAVSSIILGMGMPTTVTYIILVSLLGPALVEFGIPILAAHLFILYFGVIADITPPVAVAAYAASGVAKSDAFETGVEAFSLSLNKAIVPFAFVLAPGIVLLKTGVTVPGSDKTYRVLTTADLLDLSYSIPEVVIPVVGLFLGVIALGPTVIGHYYSSVTQAERGIFAISSLLLMAPGLLVHAFTDIVGLLGLPGLEFTIALDVALRGVGLVIFLALTVLNRRQAQRESRPIGDPEAI